MAREYWPSKNVGTPTGVKFEARTYFAWQLLSHFALVAGETRREDSTGRAVLDVMAPEEVVSRAFTLADLFFDAAEARGAVHPDGDDEAIEAFAFGGQLERVRQDHQWPEERRQRELRSERQAEREAAKTE